MSLRPADNTVWRANLTKTPAAYSCWLKRLKIRFDTLCREVMETKQMPNLRSNAAQYREENHELTFRSCCLIGNNNAALQDIFSSSAVLEAKLLDFYRGALDRDIMPSCKSLLKSFTLADLRFISLAGVMDVVSAEPVSNLDAAQTAKAVADFNLFFERLRFEQAAFRRYVVANKAYNVESHAAQTLYPATNKQPMTATDIS